MAYVDGFLLSVPKKNLEAYRKMSRKAGKVWREHGAIEYKECVADDLEWQHGRPFPKLVKPKTGEVIVFAFIVFKSRAHRDRVNKKVMKDPRLSADMDVKTMPMDVKRMSYGGFKVFVDE